MFNHWKLGAIGLTLVATTALVTGLVVANRSPSSDPQGALRDAPPPPLPPLSTAGSAAPLRTAAPPPPPSTAHAPRVPPRVVVEACHRDASARVGSADRTAEVVKDGVLGAIAGAALGAAGGAIADGGHGAGKGAAIGGIVGMGGGSLYGLNESQTRDQRYRAAYAHCMQSRGYPG